MSEMKVAVKEGDVFLIPIDAERAAGGQVIDAWSDELYVAVFDGVVAPGFQDAAAIVNSEPIFLTLTLDAKLWHGDWPVIGNIQESRRRVPQPMFKVRHSGQIYVESRDRAVFRPASEREATELRYRTVSSPAVIDEAVKAHFGVGDWNLNYGDLRSDYASSSSKMN